VIFFRKPVSTFRDHASGATEHGKIAGHIGALLLTDDMRLDRFYCEAVSLREPFEV
jgi:hypothetical protein